jgi:hypothetical protein
MTGEEYLDGLVQRISRDDLVGAIELANDKGDLKLDRNQALIEDRVWAAVCRWHPEALQPPQNAHEYLAAIVDLEMRDPGPGTAAEIAAAATGVPPPIGVGDYVAKLLRQRELGQPEAVLRTVKAHWLYVHPRLTRSQIPQVLAVMNWANEALPAERINAVLRVPLER